MSADNSRTLRDAIANRDISVAWEVWSSAAEISLSDAFCASGGPIPVKGFVRRRGVVRFKRSLYWWVKS